MTSDTFPEPAPKRPDEVMADMMRENERLRRQVEDARHERDEFKKLYLWEMSRNAEEFTEEDIANAVPAMPILEAAMKRLEKRT